MLANVSSLKIDTVHIDIGGGKKKKQGMLGYAQTQLLN